MCVLRERTQNSTYDKQTSSPCRDMKKILREIETLTTAIVILYDISDMHACLKVSMHRTLKILSVSTAFDQR